MSKLETNTIDTISGSTTLTLGGTNATTIAQDSATTVTGFKSTGIDDNATANALTIDSSSNLQFNSGFGSVTTAYGVRAWVMFTGTGTPTIQDSGNVSSLVDNGTGKYKINFTNDMPDVNYACVTNPRDQTGGTNVVSSLTYGHAVGSVNVQAAYSGQSNKTLYDATHINVVVVR